MLESHCFPILFLQEAVWQYFGGSVYQTWNHYLQLIFYALISLCLYASHHSHQVNMTIVLASMNLRRLHSNPLLESLGFMELTTLYSLQSVRTAGLCGQQTCH